MALASVDISAAGRRELMALAPSTEGLAWLGTGAALRAARKKEDDEEADVGADDVDDEEEEEEEEDEEY